MADSKVASAEELAIVKIFKENFYGKSPVLDGFNKNHDGKAGHWLEQQMGIQANANNEPDLLGFEMKNNTKNKTTFGDWSASYYIFKKPNNVIDKSQFLKIFGKPNADKNNRYSWSGSPIPTIKNRSTYNGSKMVIDKEENIHIIYDYSHDPRADKSEIVPTDLQKEEVILATWSREKLEEKLTSKFSQNGWFKCYQNVQGQYDKIAFAEPLTFEVWLNLVRQGVVFFDSGMYEGNNRLYSQWRASNTYWDAQLVREYPPF